MITPAVFQRVETLRQQLSIAMDVIEIAFSAADYIEAQHSASIKGDALHYSMAHAERVGYERLKTHLRQMAALPVNQIQSLEATYQGVDPFDQIKLDAEKEHAESEARRRAAQPKSPENTP